MSSSVKYCRCDLKYKELEPIDSYLLPQIKTVFIFCGTNGKDVIFVTNIDDVYGFGTNKGRLGLGHTSKVEEPTLIQELCGKSIVNVKSGNDFMVGLTGFGDIYTWGIGVNGKLGLNVLGVQRPQKIQFDFHLVADIRCGLCMTFVLTRTDQIYYFGHRSNNTGITCTPTHVSGLALHEMTQIDCGSDHTLALTVTGKVLSWGINTAGCLGLGQTKDREAPQTVTLGTENVFIKRISCGEYHSLLLTSDGDIYSFGSNSCGQLGIGSTTSHILSNRPKLIETDIKFTEILAFNDMSMALSQSGVVHIWGQTNKTPSNISSPLAVEGIESFQEAIRVYSPWVFTHKPLTSEDILSKKEGIRVIDTLTKAFNDPEDSDLKFKFITNGSDPKFIYVHKWFVKKSSEYFQRMFTNEWRETEGNEIPITTHSYEAYYQYIRCLYTDYIETEDIEVLMQLLAITEEYLDEKMKTKCVERIKPLVTIENVCSLYSCGLKYRSKELEDFCFQLMFKNPKSFIVTEDYQQTDSNYVKIFLTRYALKLLLF